jgi:hypothetical protein
MGGPPRRAWGIANSWTVDRSMPRNDDARMSRILDRVCWEFPEVPRSQLAAMIYGDDGGSDEREPVEPTTREP